MPSSSLFLGSCTTLVTVLSLFSVSTYALNNNGFTYSLQKEYSGSSFFDEWDFYNSADPNKGFVTYVDRSTARNSGLTSVNDGDAIMKVDSTNVYDPNAPFRGSNGHGRPSVRISTQQAFNHGLFITDIKHMPGGCGTWPAFWALGAQGNWPNSGEIDIVEGVNNRQNSLAVLHTGGQCKIAGDSRTMAGSLQHADCYYNVQTGEGAVGCAILDTDTRSYGAGLNSAGGGVFAMDWTSDAIKIWSFPRSSIPSDVLEGNPDPAGWGIPAQTFNGPGCDLDDVIKPQQLLFNTNFCGDFGEAVWQSEGCAAQTGFTTCADYVAYNPSAFTDAYWQISYLRYYQKVATTTTSTSTTDAALTTSLSSTLVTSTFTTTKLSSAVDATLITTRPSSIVDSILTTTTFSSIADVTSFTTSAEVSLTLDAALSGTTEAPFTTVETSSTNLVTNSHGILSPLTSVTTDAVTSSRGIISPLTSVTTDVTTSSSGIFSPLASVTMEAVVSVSAILITTSESAFMADTSSHTISSAELTYITSYSASAILTSASAIWEDWVEPTSLTSGKPEGSFFLPPMGGEVPITPGWNKTQPAYGGEFWSPATTTKPADSSGISTDWPDKAITTTITKTWVEPCKTGYVTKTTHIVTTHCGCTETPAPTVSMKIVTTSCPEEWGFKTPVVMTVPDISTWNPTPTWSAWSVGPTGEGDVAQTWSAWVSESSKSSAEGSAAWSVWSADSASKASTTETWSAWMADSSMVVESGRAPVESTVTWATWSATYPVATTASTSASISQVWASWDGTNKPYIAQWTGAASRTSVSVGLWAALGVAVGAATLIF